MKRKIISACLLLGALTLGASREKELLDRLPPRYRAWLTEEVVYIISPLEREVFLMLETDRERETFISAFWKQRNPTPHLPENEFKNEHYRRIAYANQWFGREAPGPGWKSDRGRIYITLGEPNSIEKYEHVNEIYPAIIWFYQSMAPHGLPDSFSVVFFKRDGVGDYELYSPVKYGPQSLLRNYSGDVLEVRQAYLQLAELEPNLADVSLSLIQGEPLTGSPSLASETLIREKIPAAPQRRVSNRYAQNFLKFKGLVEVEYADNYVESGSLLQVVRDPSGHSFIHLLIEPQRLSLEQYQNRFLTSLELSGFIADRNGKVITQIVRRIPIDITESMVARVRDKLFSYQEIIPVIPGQYRITLILKNSAGKEFTSMEREFQVPEKDSPGINALLLANRQTAVGREADFKPFIFSGRHLLISPRNDFTVSDDLVVFTQLSGLNAGLKSEGFLRYEIFRREERIFSEEKPLAELDSLPDVFRVFPLAAYGPAYYRITVSLLDGRKRETASSSADFYITPQASLPRPWVVSMPLARTDFPLFLNELGRQYLATGRLEPAEKYLAESFQRRPNDAALAADYCRLLLQLDRPGRVIEIAESFLRQKEDHSFSLLLGQASQGLGRFRQALEYYDDYLKHAGGHFQVLNAMGECHLQLGETDLARRAWTKSLELHTDQPTIREKIEKLVPEGK